MSLFCVSKKKLLEITGKWMHDEFTLNISHVDKCEISWFLMVNRAGALSRTQACTLLMLRQLTWHARHCTWQALATIPPVLLTCWHSCTPTLARDALRHSLKLFKRSKHTAWWFKLVFTVWTSRNTTFLFTLASCEFTKFVTKPTRCGRWLWTHECWQIFVFARPRADQMWNEQVLSWRD